MQHAGLAREEAAVTPRSHAHISQPPNFCKLTVLGRNATISSISILTNADNPGITLLLVVLPVPLDARYESPSLHENAATSRLLVFFLIVCTPSAEDPDYDERRVSRARSILYSPKKEPIAIPSQYHTAIATSSLCIHSLSTKPWVVLPHHCLLK